MKTKIQVADGIAQIGSLVGTITYGISDTGIGEVCWGRIVGFSTTAVDEKGLAMLIIESCNYLATDCIGRDWCYLDPIGERDRRCENPFRVKPTH